MGFSIHFYLICLNFCGKIYVMSINSEKCQFVLSSLFSVFFKHSLIYVCVCVCILAGGDD
jgi:hypothetical protein